MDLTRQPPRKPSNANMAGIVGLARMTDKARAWHDQTLGEFKYGETSGLDVEILKFIGMSADAFASAAAAMMDHELAKHVLAQANKTEEAIQVFNREHLQREPQDELYVRLLKERLKKYAPDRPDIKTVFASIELDDWGSFREKDLTREPPRSPYLRSVVGLVGAARMADKARAAQSGKLGEYRYGEDSGLDRAILAFMGIGPEVFQSAAYENPNDVELSEWLRRRVEKPAAEISIFNAHWCNLGRYGAARERLRVRRDKVAPDRTDIETVFDLLDVEDERSFGLTDLNRHPPRSTYDLSIGGVAGLARMIDKFRAFNGNTLGEYWCGEDSGFDRSILGFLGVEPEEFAEALKDHACDEAVVAWLGTRLSGKTETDRDAFNRELLTFQPQNDQMRDFLSNAIARLDPSRRDIETFAALTALDDKIHFARVKVGV